MKKLLKSVLHATASVQVPANTQPATVSTRRSIEGRVPAIPEGDEGASTCEVPNPDYHYYTKKVILVVDKSRVFIDKDGRECYPAFNDGQPQDTWPIPITVLEATYAEKSQAPEFIWDYDKVVSLETQVKMEGDFIEWSVKYAEVTNKVLRYVGLMNEAIARVHEDIEGETEKIKNFKEKNKIKLKTFKKIHPKIVDVE